MKNLFATDFITNLKTQEKSNDIETVMRWLADGDHVEFDLLDLESYFKYSCGVMRELKEIVEKDGQLFLRKEFQWDDDLDDNDERVRFDYPFLGFTKDVGAVMYHNWVIHEDYGEGRTADETIDLREKAEYTREFKTAKEWLAVGKELVCDIYSLGEMSQTAQIIEIRELYGVPYILTVTGKKYVLEPQYRLFQCEGALAWPNPEMIRS